MPAVAAIRRWNHRELVRSGVVQLFRIVDVDATRRVQARVRSPRQPARRARATELALELRLFPIFQQDERSPSGALERIERTIQISCDAIEAHRQTTRVVADAA